MYCKLCGKKIPADKEYCDECISFVGKDENTVTHSSRVDNFAQEKKVETRTLQDKVNPLLNIVAIFFPTAALIFALTEIKIFPKKSKAIIAFALIGYAIKVIRVIRYGFTVFSFLDDFYEEEPQEEPPSQGSDGGGGTLFSLMNLLNMVIR